MEETEGSEEQKTPKQTENRINKYYEDDDDYDEEDTVLDVVIEEAGYEAGDIRISGISFQVRKGELLGLIGPNGAAKALRSRRCLVC